MIRHSSQQGRLDQRAERALRERLALPQDPAEAAQAVLQVICEGLGWDAGALWWQDADGDFVRCRSVWPPTGPGLEGFRRATLDRVVRAGEGFPEAAWRPGGRFWAEDLASTPGFLRAEALLGAGMLSAAVVAIPGADGPSGAIELFSSTVRPVDDDVIELVSRLAALYGDFVARLRLGAEGDADLLGGAIIRAAPTGVVTIDERGTILSLNPAAERLFGYAPSMAVGRNIADVLVPATFREAQREGLARFVETGRSALVGRSIETTAVRINGKEIPIELFVAETSVAGRRRFTAYMRDRTEQVLRDEGVRRAGEFRDELVGLISHELRGPITSILGEANLIMRSASGVGDETQQSLTAIMESVDRLDRVAASMLALGRAESGADVEREPVLIQRVVPKVIERFLATRAGRKVHFEPEPELPAVLAEPTFLEQIVENLLTNAHKYGPPDKPIHVAARSHGASVDVSVRDEGEGIAPDELRRLFEPFFRAERSSARAPGIGLGLTVCKRLVAALGGRIWVDVPAEGGTRFTFSLPIALE